VRPAIALLLAGSLCSCATFRGSREVETVEAEGWAPDAPADLLGTRHRAIVDAQRRAIEKVVGLWVDSRTQVDLAVTVTSRQRALSRGAIKKYEVLDERREDGFLKVVIRATVAKRAEPAGEKGSVKLAIEDAELSSAVRQALSELGFSVVEGEADYTVRGQASASRVRGSPFPGFLSYRASVSLQSGSASGERQASALDPSGELAREKAVRLAAKLAAESLVSALSKREDSALQ
jgi:hypothetical protein